jgi:hypothetical protein
MRGNQPRAKDASMNGKANANPTILKTAAAVAQAALQAS